MTDFEISRGERFRMWIAFLGFVLCGVGATLNIVFEVGERWAILPLLAGLWGCGWHLQRLSRVLVARWTAERKAQSTKAKSK